MFVASQLADTARRFPAHVEEIRELLLKEGFAVPSVEAIPELSSRLKTDQRVRADVSSLVRAVMYREREQIGYEDLLGILLAAAAGTEQDLTSDAQETSAREMLRFLLQSRRSSFRAEVEEPAGAVEMAAAEAVAAPIEVAAPVSVPVEAEAVHAVHAAPRWAVESVRREPRAAESGEAVAVAETREAQTRVAETRVAETRVAKTQAAAREHGEWMLPPLRTTGLFAAQAEPEVSRWRTHAIWVVGVVGVLLGVGTGLMLRRGLPVSSVHVTAPAANVASSERGKVGAVAARGADARSKAAMPRRNPAATAHGTGHEDEAGLGTAAKPSPAAGVTAEPKNDRAAVQPAAGEPAPVVRTNVPDLGVAGAAGTASVHVPDGAAVPVTVVRQVVTASENDEVESEPTPTKAATHTIVQPGTAGIMAANVIYSPPPDYPAEASAENVQGAVTVRAVVDPEGHVIYARVVSGPTLLRDAALEAVQKWRYRPLLYFGKPIAVTTTAILDFRREK